MLVFGETPFRGGWQAQLQVWRAMASRFAIHPAGLIEPLEFRARRRISGGLGVFRGEDLPPATKRSFPKEGIPKASLWERGAILETAHLWLRAERDRS